MRHFIVILALILTALLPGHLAMAQQDTISTAIGGGPDHMPAIDANLDDPIQLAIDSSGSFYVAAYDGHRAYKVDNTGLLTIVAGNGLQGYSGDGTVGGAAQASLNGPTGIAVDSSHNIYIADYTSCVIRKVDTSNTITTIAGMAGLCGFSGDGSPATSFKLYQPYGITLDKNGNLYIADFNNCRVRKLVLSTGAISTVAGTGSCSYGGDTGPATSATLNGPSGVATDNAGNLYIADTYNYKIRMVTVSTGIITTIAGTTNGFAGDGGPALSAKIGQVFAGITVDPTGSTVTLSDYTNDRIRQFTVNGNINTIAGKGSGGFCGDGSPAIQACLFNPEGVVVTAAGIVTLSDRNNNRLRQFTLTGGLGGNISTIAGNGSATLPTTVNGIPPQGVVFDYAWGVVKDPSGNVFVSDQNNCMVRKLVEPSNVVNTFAGTGTCGYGGDNGPATAANLNQVYGVARDSSGNIYIADTINHIIRKVDTGGTITTFAGTPQSAGYSGDGGVATSAKLRNPYGVFVDSSNNLYIADTSNYVIRKVTGGTITTVAGIGGQAGYLGDGNPATSAKLNSPYGVSGDAAGNIYIADTSNHVIRKVGTNGIITTVAGDGIAGFDGDGLATIHSLYAPKGVLADANGNLFIADTSNQRLRFVDTSGNMITFAGTGSAGYSGDGGAGFLSKLYNPSSIAQDTAGNLLVADWYNWRIRGLTAFSALDTSAGSLAFGITTINTSSSPQTVTLSAVGPVTFSSITATGDFTEFDNCGSSLANAQTCRVYVVFKPKAAGVRTGTLTILHNGFFNQSTVINLTGTGSAVSVTGGPVNFDNQASKTTSAPKPVTVTNMGTAAVTMRTITINETTDFAISSNTCPASGQKLAAAASCTINLVFKPQTTGLKKGALIVNDSDASSPQVVGMSGTGISNVSLSPATITFPTQAVGTSTTSSAAKKITLTNNTGASLTLGNPAIAFTGPFSKLGASSCANSLVIAPGGTCTILVIFAPTAVGYPTGTVTVTDSDATSPQTVPLSGTATGVLFTPSSVNFGTSTVNHQVQSTVTITNVGPTYVYFTGWIINGTNAKDFTTNASDPPCSGTLAPAAACTFTMYFTPTIIGAESASFLVYDNSPGTPQTLSLTGTGQ